LRYATISILSSQALRRLVRLKAIKEKAEKINMEMAMTEIVPRFKRRFPRMFWSVRLKKYRRKNIRPSWWSSKQKHV
jgi:hypothetical protein